MPRRLLALALCAAAATLFTWPLARHPTTLLGAPADPGDPILNLWVLGWDLQTISRHPLWLLTGRIFDANIFYPATGTLAYSDHQIPQALAVWPIYALTQDVVLCYNIVLVLSLALSAWTMYLFVREVTGREVAAIVAGAVWGFCPYHITQLIHLQLQALYLLPLSFLFLHRVVSAGRRRDALWLGCVLGLQTLTSIYYGLIGAVGLAMWAATLLLTTGAWRRRGVIRLVAVAAMLAGVISIIGVWPYWSAQRREGIQRGLFEAAQHEAVVASYVQAPSLNVLYGRTGWLRPPSGGGGPLGRREGPEQDLFPGFVVIALAIAGWIAAGPLELRPLARSALVAGLTGFVLSLGPDGVRPLYSALHRWVFGFQAIRAPARFSVLVFFALATLAGLGAERLSRGRRMAGPLRPWVTAALLLLLAAEFFSGAIPFAAAPARSTPSGQWLTAASGPGAVVYLPLRTSRDASRFMLASLEHGRPVVNGYSGAWPQFYPALVESLAAFPGPEALLALRDIGVRFVVSPEPVSGGPDPTPIVERARVADGVIYELVWTPEAVGAVAAAAEEPPPPPAGELPFQTSETLRYRVRWLDGPVALVAGEAVLTASRDVDGFDLSLNATTAPWMQRFFEANDTFETEADRQLLPSRHRQALHEGRRHVVRTLVFDRANRRVSIQTGDAEPIALPLGSAARDPLSAFWYVRTLPLETGLRVRVPVNDAGRAMVLDLQVTGWEQVNLDGRPADAWRLEPRLVSRVERRQPPQITVWVSRDAQRVPLVARVVAVFGTIEAELVERQAQ